MTQKELINMCEAKGITTGYALAKITELAEPTCRRFLKKHKIQKSTFKFIEFKILGL